MMPWRALICMPNGASCATAAPPSARAARTVPVRRIFIAVLPVEDGKRLFGLNVWAIRKYCMGPVGKCTAAGLLRICCAESACSGVFGHGRGRRSRKVERIGGHRMRENWDDLRFLLAVAEEGSVSGAARRLGVNHATVLRRIASYEATAGVEI